MSDCPESGFTAEGAENAEDQNDLDGITGSTECFDPVSSCDPVQNFGAFLCVLRALRGESAYGSSHR